MPGLIIASRRWNIGSDDLLLPSSFYLVSHLLWYVLIMLWFLSFFLSGFIFSRIIIYSAFSWKNKTLFFDKSCSTYLTFHTFGQFVLMIGFIFLEICIIRVSLRGSILNTKARSFLNILLYFWFSKF